MKVDDIAKYVAPEEAAKHEDDAKEDLKLFMDFMKSLTEEQTKAVETMLNRMKTAEDKLQDTDSDGNEKPKSEDGDEFDNEDNSNGNNDDGGVE